MRVCLRSAILILLAGAVAVPAQVWRQEMRSGSHPIPVPDAEATYGVLISASRAAVGRRAVDITLETSGKILAGKRLHVGDVGLYTLIRGAAGVSVRSSGPIVVTVTALGKRAYLEAEPNNRWEDATPIAPGTTIWASGDEAPYIPETLPGKIEPNPHEDWFRFEWRETAPKLVNFALELVDRDNIPVDVSVHRLRQGKLEEFSEGEDPVTLPHEVQALPGNKFTTRVLREPGSYFIRVKLTHPAYRLTTRVADAPPYRDPRQAVQAGIDYLIGAGDSWHANTPRRGGLFNRVASNHQETTLCVACHATHFTQRAQLYALRKGYPVHYPDQLSFLAERFYNNPRPLYGFEEQGAVWARVISASANVLGRMSHLLQVYEKELTGDPRPVYHQGVGEYLSIYYRNRAKLPGDETNGNTPLVSTYEVAWYAWESSRDPKIAALLEQDHEIKNTIDLAYQTLALAAVDPVRHEQKIRKNADRLLGMQRPDGQWSARFEDGSFPVEFQTGHVLWALQAAGIPKEDPRVAKGLRYLLSRQQPFGGWLDPLQSYENFRTPFRETQMAVLALSAYYPLADRSPGWPEAHGTPGSLEELNSHWRTLDGAELTRITRSLDAVDVLVRAQAAEALGRAGKAESLVPLVRRLNDESKIVSRAAAWAIRQIYNRRPEAPAAPLLDALRSRDAATRWGATRVFATHFAALARREEFAAPLAALLADPDTTVAMQAAKGVWQFWYWSPSDAVRSRLEDAVLARLGVEKRLWVDRNLREAVYNLADENIRYLYNNWVPSIAEAADRERVIRGRLAVEARLAGKFARILETGKPAQVRALLAGLSEFELRRGDVYDPTADHATVFPGIYNRIGNDVEQAVFFGPANTQFAAALAPHLKSSDPEIRRLALLTGQLVRDVPFAEVARLAGPPGEARAPILAAIKAAQPPPVPRGASGPRSGPAAARPDDAYFRGYVEPILTTRGKDGQACVHCHASHTLFNATLTTARNVINLEDPESSLLLVKPTSSAETEGVVNASKSAHGGGIRFEKGSPEYNTILNWIRGTKP